MSSEVGVGTTFQLHLPAFHGSFPDENPPPAAAGTRCVNILLMDDEESLRKATARVLRHLGHTVEEVGDGTQAVAAYARARDARLPFDLVILDLTVRAGMGGQESILELLKMDPKVKAVAVSGYSEDPVILSPGRFGFRDGITKPFDVVALRDAIAKVIAS